MKHKIINVGDAVKIRSNDDFHGKEGTVTKISTAIVIRPVEVQVEDLLIDFMYEELVVKAEDKPC